MSPSSEILRDLCPWLRGSLVCAWGGCLSRQLPSPQLCCLGRRCWGLQRCSGLGLCRPELGQGCQRRVRVGEGGQGLTWGARPGLRCMGRLRLQPGTSPWEGWALPCLCGSSQLGWISLSQGPVGELPPSQPGAREGEGSGSASCDAICCPRCRVGTDLASPKRSLQREARPAGDAPGSPGQLRGAGAGSCPGLVHPRGAVVLTGAHRGLRVVPMARGWGSLLPCWRQPSRFGPWFRCAAQPGAPCSSRGAVTAHPRAGMGARLSSPRADVRMLGEGAAIKPQRAAAGQGLAEGAGPALRAAGGWRGAGPLAGEFLVSGFP